MPRINRAIEQLAAGNPRAAGSVPSWSTSAISTFARSGAKVRAISRPMPLAAPVTMATLSQDAWRGPLAVGSMTVDGSARAE
jgi:hypothetical protein